MFIFDNVFHSDVIDTYKNKIDSHYKYQVSIGSDPEAWKPTRNLVITDDPIVTHIRNFIESKLRVRLTIDDAEMQTWHEGVWSEMHKHTFNGREEGDYNSLLYLNDDFQDGEFYTDDIIIKPLKNRLTFFNGRDIMHGVNTVKGANRYTIICWWKNTKFY